MTQTEQRLPGLCQAGRVISNNAGLLRGHRSLEAKPDLNLSHFC